MQAGNIGHGVSKHRDQAGKMPTSTAPNHFVDADPRDEKVGLLQDLEVAQDLVCHKRAPSARREHAAN